METRKKQNNYLIRNLDNSTFKYNETITNTFTMGY